MWPTCMGLAMLGLEKSITTVLPVPIDALPYCAPFDSISESTARASTLRSILKFRYGPSTETLTPSIASLPASSLATAGGGRFCALAIGKHGKARSPCAGSRGSSILISLCGRPVARARARAI